MVTISAIIFIYPANIPLAAVAIINMDDAGDIAPAAAMSALIVCTSIGQVDVFLFDQGITSGLKQLQR
jgi:iron(III) transport system permease protein